MNQQNTRETLDEQQQAECGAPLRRSKFWRAVRRLRAFLGGYFWLPCPACGEMFAGFEMARHHLMISPDRGKCVCRDCDESARQQNIRFMWEQMWQVSPSGPQRDLEIRFVDYLRRLEIRPGDHFVLTVPGAVSASAAHHIQETWREYVKTDADAPEGCAKLLILDSGMRLGVFSDRDEE